MSVERTVNGYWRISAIIGGYREQRIYGGYTRREAVKLFRQEFNITGGGA